MKKKGKKLKKKPRLRKRLVAGLRVRYPKTRRGAHIMVTVLVLDILFLLFLGPVSSNLPVRPSEVFGLSVEAPSMCVDEDGNSYIVWSYATDVGFLGHGEADTLFFRKVDPDGKVVENRRLTRSDPQCQSPQLLMDSKGHLHLFWISEYQYVFYMKLDRDGEKIVSERRVLEDYTVGEGYLPHRLHIDSRDRIHMINENGYFLLDDRGRVVDEYTQLKQTLKKAFDWVGFRWWDVRFSVDPHLRSHIFITNDDVPNVRSLILDTSNDDIRLEKDDEVLFEGDGLSFLGFDPSGNLNLLLPLSNDSSPEDDGKFPIRLYTLDPYHEILEQRNITTPVFPQHCRLDLKGNIVIVHAERYISLDLKTLHLYQCRIDTSGNVVSPASTIFTLKITKASEEEKEPKFLFWQPPKIFHVTMTVDSRGDLHLLWCSYAGFRDHISDHVQYVRLNSEDKKIYQDLNFGRKVETRCNMCCSAVLLLGVNLVLVFRAEKERRRKQRARPETIFQELPWDQVEDTSSREDPPDERSQRKCGGS